MKIYPAGNVLGILCFMALVLVLAPAVAAEAWTGRVVHVSDGDTIHVEPVQGGQRVKVRLYGIDCPEKNQPFGSLATAYVFDVALYKRVEVEAKDTDRYGRTVAVIVMPDGSYLQDGLVRNGFAWVYARYCRDKGLKARWSALEKEAVEQRRGLWKEIGTKCPPVAPWQWRRGAKGE